METITVKSSDDKTFEVDVEVMKCSELISQIIDPSLIPGEVKIEESAYVVEKIIEWANHHKPNFMPVPEDTSNAIFYIRDWDINFFEGIPIKHLPEMLTAAKSHQIRKLYYHIIQYLVNKIKGRSVQDIREYFTSPKAS